MSGGEEDPFAALEALLDQEEATRNVGVKRKRAESEESADVCPVCQDVPEHPKGVLPRCKHEFCFECISEWAKRSNVCPMCKGRFGKINKVNKTGKTVGSKKVKKRDFEDYDNDIDSDDYLSEEAEVCMICGSSDDPGHLMYCDYAGCTQLQHSYCCFPTVAEPPEDGEFYCQDCYSNHSLPTQWTTVDPNINLALKKVQEQEAAEAAERQAKAASAATIDAAAAPPQEAPREPAPQARRSPAPAPPARGGRGRGGGVAPPVGEAAAAGVVAELEGRGRGARRGKGGGKGGGADDGAAPPRGFPNFTPAVIPKLEGPIIPPPPPRNPNVPQGLMHLVKPPSSRATAIVSVVNTRPHSVRQLRDAFARTNAADVPRTLANTPRRRPHPHGGFAGGLTSLGRAPVGSRSAATTPGREASRSRGDVPPLDTPSPQGRGEGSQHSGTPKRSLSLAEWSQKFAPEPSESQVLELQEASCDTLGSSQQEALGPTQLLEVEDMLQDLRSRIRRDRQDRREKRKRSVSEIYAARAAIIAAVGCALGTVVRNAEARERRVSAATYPPEKMVAGVFVPTPARNAVVGNIKRLLMPAYTDQVISKDQFKVVATKCLSAYLSAVVVRHQRTLLRDQRKLPQHEFVKTVYMLITTADEVIELEALCREHLRAFLRGTRRPATR